MASTNYYNTFIRVADDCAAGAGQAPPTREGEPTVARLQYELLSGHDYVLTSDDVLFAVHAAKHDVPPEERARARAAFFARSQACLRSSPLAKRYGWGIHFDWEGRIALYGRERADYERLASDWTVRQLKAMRSRRP
jgi:hypothetical protein